MADSLRHALFGRSESLIVPHLLDVEVASALRRVTTTKRIDSYVAEQLLTELAVLPAERYPHTPLLSRIWELRQNFTAYDATYVALAERTGSVLYTCDAKLRTGHRAQVVLLAKRSEGSGAFMHAPLPPIVLNKHAIRLLG